MNPDKTYLGMAEGDFKKRYNNHTKSHLDTSGTQREHNII